MSRKLVINERFNLSLVIFNCILSFCRLELFPLFKKKDLLNWSEKGICLYLFLPFNNSYLILNHMYSHPYVTILNLAFSLYLRRDFIIKTNLLCNPPLGSPVEVKKTFLSHSSKPFINFYYHDFHYSFAIHLPFLFVYIYLSGCSLSLLRRPNQII